jgi:hypothetical protein
MDVLTRLWNPKPHRGRVADRIYERWVLGMSDYPGAEERAYEFEALLQSFAERRIAADGITDTAQLVRAVLDLSDEAATHGPWFVLAYCRRVARLYAGAS